MSEASEINKWSKRFRIISLVEGISFLLLLFIAMPLKYIFDFPLAVKYVGWAHGILFMLYLGVVVPTALSLKWTYRMTFFAFVASVFPFGPFIFESYLHRKSPSES